MGRRGGCFYIHRNMAATKLREKTDTMLNRKRHICCNAIVLPGLSHVHEEIVALVAVVQGVDAK